MPSFNIPRQERGKPYLKPFHGQVFTKDEITEVVQTYRLPKDRWKIQEAWRYDRFIEAQIWDVRPIDNFIAYNICFKYLFMTHFCQLQKLHKR